MAFLFILSTFNDLTVKDIIDEVSILSPIHARGRTYYLAEKIEPPDYNYYIRDNECRTIIHFQTPYRLRYSGELPFDTDFPVLLNFVRNDSLFVKRLSFDRKLKGDYFIMKGKDNYKMEKGWDGAVRFFYYEVKNGDTLLYGRMNTYWDADQRGFIIYSLNKRKVVFYYKTGPLLISSFMIDVDGDGIKDFVSGSYAVHNGCELNGTSDKNSYIFAVSPVKGLLYRIQTTSDFYAETQIDTFSENGHKYIIAYPRYTESAENREDSLIILSINGKIVRGRKTGLRSYNAAIFKDIDFDMKPEIIICSKSGKLKIFNTELELIKEKNLKMPVEQPTLFDIDGNGDKEIIIPTRERKLIVLNEKLKKIVDYDLKQFDLKFIGLIENQEEGKNQMIFRVMSQKGETYTLILKPIFSFKSIFSVKNILLFLSIVSLSLMGVFLFFYIKDRNCLKSFFENDNRGILIVSRKGKVKKMNKKAMEILKNGFEIKNGDAGIKILKLNNGDEKEIKILDKKIWYILDDEEEKNKYIVKKWIPYVQKVVHDMKNTINLIDLTVKKDKKDIEKYIKRLFDQTVLFLNLSKTTHLNKKRYDVVKILKDIVEEYNSVLKEQRLIAQFDVEKYNMNIDKDKFESALRNLIKNALEATEKKGKVYVKTGIENLVDEKEIISKNFVITIEDTGKGMSKEELKNIFSFDFSRKKKGSGVGLGIAKTVIELHKGEIDIVSEKGKGTIITLRFKHG